AGLSAAPLSDAALTSLAAALPVGTDGATEEVVIGDTAWLAHVTPIEFGDETGEFLLVALPRDTLTAEIDRMTHDAVLVTLLILLAATPFLWLVARGLSRPLKRLAVSADAIRRFELDGTEGTTSRIAEIERLEQAMAEMRGSLRTFAVYVPKTLVKQLLEQASAPRLGGTRRDITVLFMDIENFTAMSADLEPEEVMRRMSRYFEVVTAILLAHDATIDKYIGDAVMAFWNAPADTTAHTRKACAAAIEIAEAAERETRGWHRRGKPRLRTRIGIHRGEAIVGNVGSSDRMNYTALGATVNLAARLETLNRDRHTDILVSQAVVDRLRDDQDSPFRFTPAGETTLRGFAEPVAVYELSRPG
ncbi:MAG: adenylate/guanylate cyclase domain-containing protein, partial [Azospirillaceae bacterium]